MPAGRSAIVCFGEVLVDLLAEPGQPRRFVEYAGGAPANVSAAVARLGGEARFIGMLGQDMFGEFLAQSLRDAGVDIRYSRSTDQAPTALAFVSLQPDGERQFSFYRPPAADLLFRIDDLHPDSLRDAAILHVCSNSFTEPAIADTTLAIMRQARANGALVSMDLNLRPSLWPRGADPATRLWPALLDAELVKLCQDELAFLARDAGGIDAVYQRLWQGQAHAVVVTDGAQPLSWRTRTATGTLDSFTVATLDSTAAGDAFVGGLLQRLVVLDIDLQHAFDDAALRTDLLRHGAATGALATTRHGAFAAMPDAAAVANLLERSP